MHWKSHCHRKKSDEHPNKAKERFDPFSVDFGVGNIVTEKENDQKKKKLNKKKKNDKIKKRRWKEEY